MKRTPGSREPGVLVFAFNLRARVLTVA